MTAVGHRRAVALLVAPLLAASTACASPSRATDAAGAPAAWSALAASVTAGADDVCSPDAAACVGVVAGELRRRAEALVEACDHRAPWVLFYLRVTEQVEAQLARPGTYRDPTWVARLTATFAAVWVAADDAWQDGRRSEVPPAWRELDEAAAGEQVPAVGDVVLGVNAHISGDLPGVLARLAEPGIDHHPDFETTNQVFETTLQPGLDEVAARLDPTATAVAVAGIGDRPAVLAAIAAWREEAWARGVQLATATDPAPVRADIAAVADGRSRTIRLAASYPPLLGAAAARDAYCRGHR